MSGPSAPNPMDAFAAVSPGGRKRRRNELALEAMADPSAHGPRTPRVRGPKSKWPWAEWILLPGVAITAFVLVLLGDGEFTWKDDPFKAIDAFTSGFPSEQDVEGVAITLGRVLAPVVALYATIRLVMVLYTQRIREWRVRNFKDHTVVVGLGETGLRAVDQYRRSGRVVAVTERPFSPAAEDALRTGAYVVAGSGRDRATLHAAGVGRAQRIVCAEGDDVVNVEIALDGEEARNHANGSQEPLEILVETTQPSPAAALLEAAAQSSRVTVFSLREVWAWRLLAAGPLWRYATKDDVPPRIVIAGENEVARALLACACRWWHFDAVEQDSEQLLTVHVVAPDATEICAEALTKHPEMRETVQLTPVAVDFAEAFDAIRDTLKDRGSPWTVYVCLDASDAVRRAFARVLQLRLGGSREGSIVVAVSRGSSQTGDVDPPIQEVKAETREDGLDLSRVGRTEALARSIHGVYERHIREDGIVSAPALKPFDELPEGLQESNRAQARQVDEQLTAVLMTTVPLRDWSRVHAFSAREIEVLAELEHIRWCAERTAAAWTYGETRSDERRQHPDLVPWAELTEKRREIDREFMRRRPWTLARVGEAVVPHPAREQLARLTHELYRRDVEPSASPWSDLSESEIAGSRDFVEDIPRKMLSSGGRIAAPSDPLPTRELTEENLERLAREDHERWLAFQVRHSPEDADSDRVTWAELPQERQDVDRLLVRAIPELLAKVGLRLVRIAG